jgi:hypothetical protein
VIAAIIIAGPLEVVDREVWSRMRAQGIWGVNKTLDGSEEAEVKKGMLGWFGQKVIWGSIEASVLLQVFYWLTVGLEGWRRERRNRR